VIETDYLSVSFVLEVRFRLFGILWLNRRGSARVPCSADRWHPYDSELHSWIRHGSITLGSVEW
jgi:hypothetical protein